MENTNKTAAAVNVAEIAKTAAAAFLTCKDLKRNFKTFVDKYGKETAKEIETAAANIIKGRKIETAAAAADCVETLKNGRKVASAAWEMLLDEDTKGAQFARIVFDSCGRNLETVIRKYAQYIDGNTIACRKVERDDNGTITAVYYTAKNIESVSGYLSALKTAVKNAKRAALGDANYQKAVIIKNI